MITLAVPFKLKQNHTSGVLGKILTDEDDDGMNNTGGHEFKKIRKNHTNKTKVQRPALSGKGLLDHKTRTRTVIRCTYDRHTAGIKSAFGCIPATQQGLSRPSVVCLPHSRD